MTLWCIISPLTQSPSRLEFGSLLKHLNRWTELNGQTKSDDCTVLRESLRLFSGYCLLSEISEAVLCSGNDLTCRCHSDVPLKRSNRRFLGPPRRGEPAIAYHDCRSKCLRKIDSPKFRIHTVDWTHTSKPFESVRIEQATLALSTLGTVRRVRLNFTRLSSASSAPSGVAAFHSLPNNPILDKVWSEEFWATTIFLIFLNFCKLFNFWDYSPAFSATGRLTRASPGEPGC